MTRSTVVAAAVALTLFVLGALLVSLLSIPTTVGGKPLAAQGVPVGVRNVGPAAVPPDAAAPRGPTVPAGARPLPVKALPPATPAGLEIPSIGLHAGPIVELGLQPDGTLRVPDDATTVGWYTQSPTPGERGPSVLLGHVDYRRVPGVFQRLHELRPGDEVVTHRGDGTSAVFTVTRLDRYPKSAFPSDAVYGNTAAAELRLITCGGSYDPDTGHYRDNVVAFARLERVWGP